MATLKLEAFYGKMAAPRLAKLLRDSIREVIGIQAPVALVGGRFVALTPAVPGAPPRRVSGRLWISVQARGSRVYVLAPYGEYLERDNHKFLQRAKDLLKQKSRSSNVVVKG